MYVLVKKQDEPEEIVIPTVAPTPPSKPEVYFIRYKTQVRVRECVCVPSVPKPTVSLFASPFPIDQRSSAEHGSNGGGPYPESGAPTPPTEYGPPPVPSQSPSNSYGVPL